MSKHIFKGLAAAIIVMLLMVFTAVPVLAFDVRSGDTVTVARGEVVDGPLYVAAGDTITIDGTVNGGLRAAARTINVNGIVNGNVIAVGQTINISGEVRSDVIVGCVSLNVADRAKIKGILLFGAGIARIEGNVEGSGSAVAVGNGVKGNGAFKIGSLTILPVASIPGNLSNANAQESDVQSGAQLIGKTTDTPPPAGAESAIANPVALFSGALGKLMGFLMALIAGLVIILLAPRRLTSIAESIRTKLGASAGWGAIVLIVTPIAAVLVCLTVVGLSVGLIALAIYGIAIYLAQIPVGLLIGRLIIGRFRAVEGKAIMVGALASGLVVITLLRLIPYFGFFVGLAVIIFGLGAVVVLERQRRAEAREVALTES